MTKFLKVWAAALLGVLLSASVHAAPITINFTGAVDFFNPGPFTQNVPLSGEIVLDDTVVATGPNNSFNNVITSLTLTISEPAGAVVYTSNGTGGRVQQFIGASSTEFVSVAFGGGAGGTFNIPSGAPVITSFNIDFRGADLFVDPTVLATGLTAADFSFSRANYNFDNGGTNLLMVERALDTVTFSGERQIAAVNAPGAALLMAIAVCAVVLGASRRRGPGMRHVFANTRLGRRSCDPETAAA
tara:strand:- start:2867 stop:3598 length:732 start_codon:yes stop_codon:yes gene_type:complete